MKSKSLVLTNLSNKVSLFIQIREKDIENAFEKYGKITKIKLKEIKCFQAEVTYENQSNAEEAYDKSNMIELKGQNVYVNYQKISENSRSASYSSRSRQRSRSRKRERRYSPRKRSYSNDRNRNIECYNCHKFGHISRNCLEARRQQDSRGKCFKCGATGHKQMDCRSSRNNQKRKHSSSRSSSSYSKRSEVQILFKSRSQRFGRKDSNNS